MKKLVSGLAFAAVMAPAFAAPVTSAPVKKTFGETIASWFDGVWYGGIRGELSFLNWKNDYSFSAELSEDGYTEERVSESFSFEPVFGGSLSFGHIFDEHWRGEVEAGIIGRFSDSGYGAHFELTTPYITLNALYDFDNDMYVGGGLGIAVPKVEFGFTSFDSKKSGISPMFALMIGYSYEMDASVTMDFRYRLAGLFGPQTKADGVNAYVGSWVESDTGFILDNSISIGLRYSF